MQRGEFLPTQHRHEMHEDDRLIAAIGRIAEPIPHDLTQPVKQIITHRHATDRNPGTIHPRGLQPGKFLVSFLPGVPVDAATNLASVAGDDIGATLPPATGTLTNRALTIDVPPTRPAGFLRLLRYRQRGYR